ncbi:PTS transporter subunit EIIB [Olsenella sp. DNF00959]|uniref:PTS transporter subunit EIIB n=2 Tax=Olsenella TaxID=133925 RepID=UPI000782FF9E|nr:PTS transporter subunit EIIB [Olsenella sp. DNF00959]KXB63261.1 phosphotransferase system, EIIB [Olsenella sp. DNF00959]
MDPAKSAAEILEAVGGKENISDVSHCFTRLRLVLKDEGKVDQKRVEQTEGVIQVVKAQGQFQVVLGAKVEKVYDALLPMAGIEGTGLVDAETGKPVADEPKGKLGDRILQTVAKMFTPLIPAIAAAGLIKGLLTAAKLIFARQGIDIATSDTYVLLYAAS